MENRFNPLLEKHHPTGLQAKDLRILQCNIIRTCNMACRHCHVESSPKRTERMSWDTMARILDMVDAHPWQQVDITGGAPELHPDFRRFVAALRARKIPVQVRSNLTVHLLPELEGCLSFLAEQQVAMVASLPCYLESNVEKQRGKGVFSSSVIVLQRLNELGYGRDPQLPLHLVYNPVGTGLPGPQADLEAAYRKELYQRYHIEFSGLYTITNMPIGRFAQDLAKQQGLDDYLDRLANAFNPDTIDGLMCRHQVEIDYDGSLYDCDFNLALGLPITGASIHDLDLRQLRQRRIITGTHCLGCTAGCGSSCGGALVDGQNGRRQAG